MHIAQPCQERLLLLADVVVGPVDSARQALHSGASFVTVLPLFAKIGEEYGEGCCFCVIMVVLILSFIFLCVAGSGGRKDVSFWALSPAGTCGSKVRTLHVEPKTGDLAGSNVSDGRWPE